MFKDLIKLERFPTTWCPGCGLGQILIQTAKAMDELGLDHTNSAVISGIGCTGRIAVYFNLDGVHTLHGRALPVAEAVKLVQPDLHVIVISGDGDLTSIGGNHLLHAARRNARLTVLCADNEVYALTGGQTGPTTPRDTVTISSPMGVPYDPLDIQGLLKSYSTYWYARTTVFHQEHLRHCLKEAIAWPGFAFIDAKSPCIENNGRRIGFDSPFAMLQDLRKTYKRAPEGAVTLGRHELGIVSRRVGEDKA